MINNLKKTAAENDSRFRNDFMKKNFQLYVLFRN
jgi:hypothetical protein